MYLLYFPKYWFKLNLYKKNLMYLVNNRSKIKVVRVVCLYGIKFNGSLFVCFSSFSELSEGSAQFACSTCSVLSCVTQYFNITHKTQQKKVDVKNLQANEHVVSIPPQRSNHGAPLADFFGYGKLLNVDVIRISVVIKELLIISLASWFAYPRIFW